MFVLENRKPKFCLSEQLVKATPPRLKNFSSPNGGDEMDLTNHMFVDVDENPKFALNEKPPPVILENLSFVKVNSW